MNLLAQKFFSPRLEKKFSNVRILSEEKQISWQEASHASPQLPRGWYELSRISAEDRVEFTREYWLDQLPYHPVAHPLFFEFFERLDDVAVVLIARIETEPMEAELVYSLADNSSFFRGKPPCQDRGLQEMKEELKVLFPQDYLAFLRLHDGFGKLSEMGILSSFDLGFAHRRVADLLLKMDPPIRRKEGWVDPHSLFPFFEALGLSSFQCFYRDWYPGSEMGNVYVSGIDGTISDLTVKRAWSENLAFASFSEWFADYLQGMNLCT